MADPATDYGKVDRDSRKTSPQDNFSQIQELENIDVLNTFWAIVTSRSPDYYDQYTVDVYADEKFTSIIAANCTAFSVDIRRYSISDRVRVYWRPATQFALIFMRSPFAWIKLTKDWAPNEDRVFGKRCDSAGVLLEPQDAEVVIALTGTGLKIAYCPFKKDAVITYWRWPFEANSTWQAPGSYDGVCMGFPQIPMPTSLHQVLICVGQQPNALSSDTFRIAFGSLRTMDRIQANNDNTPAVEEGGN